MIEMHNFDLAHSAVFDGSDFPPSLFLCPGHQIVPNDAYGIYISGFLNCGGILRDMANFRISRMN